MCNVLCRYVIRISGLEELLTTKAETIVLGIGPKCGLSTLRSTSKISELNFSLVYLHAKTSLSDCF